MTQVARLAMPDAAIPEIRSTAGDAGPAPGEKGAFSDIFETLGGKSSEADSGAKPAAAPSEKSAAPSRSRAAGALPGSGLHRLLASGRLAPAAPSPRAGQKATEAEAGADAGEAGDAPDLPKISADKVEAGAAADLVMPSTAMAVPTAPAAAEATKPVKTLTANAKPEAKEGRPARGVIVVTPEAEDGTPAAPVRVPVTVESIETHFAPIETNASVAEAAIAASAPPADRPAIAKVGQRVAPAKAAAAAVAGMHDVSDSGDADGSAPSAKVARSARAVPEPSRRAHSLDADTEPAVKSEAGRAAAKTDAAPADGPATALPAATIRQVGDAIAGTARDMTQQAAAVAAQDGGATRAVVKVLNVRLDPPEYGSLSVRLTLQGGALSVQIRAERESTAAALDHDREKLAEHLKASGYGTDASMIDTRRDVAAMRSDGSANANANGGAGGSGGSPGQAAAGGQSPGNGAMARREGNSGQGFARDREERRDGAAVPDPGAGNLYV
jgi:chemotaxis protein MotD